MGIKPSLNIQDLDGYVSMPEIRVSELYGSFKDFSKGKTARQLLEEGRREEFIQDKKLEGLALKSLQKQRLPSKRKPA